MFDKDYHAYDTVAPFVGAWIEICDDYCGSGFLGSLRSSERGLKFLCVVMFGVLNGRSVRRSVD